MVKKSVKISPKANPADEESKAQDDDDESDEDYLEDPIGFACELMGAADRQLMAIALD